MCKGLVCSFVMFFSKANGSRANKKGVKKVGEEQPKERSTSGDVIMCIELRGLYGAIVAPFCVVMFK